jgi:hypothetical protein
MDEVFGAALHRVIVPQRVNGDFVIEVEDTDDDEEVEGHPSGAPRSARGRAGGTPRPDATCARRAPRARGRALRAARRHED